MNFCFPAIKGFIFSLLLSLILIFQLVQPAFQSMLGHLRSGTLDKFKEAFGKALIGGEAFSSAVSSCTQICMAQFDEGSAGAVIFILAHFRTLVYAICN